MHKLGCETMGYKVDYDALDSFYTAIGNQVSNWSTEVEEIQKKFAVLKNTSNMSGEAADNVKNYILYVHETIITLLMQLISTHSNNCFLYKKDYQMNIDTGLHSCIESAELEDFNGRIGGTKSTAIGIDNSLFYVLNGIKDILTIKYDDIEDVARKHDWASNYLTNLNQDILDLEKKHVDNDFNSTTDLISSIKTFINEQLSQNRSYRINFTTESLSSSKAFYGLYQSALCVEEENSSKAEEIETAIENENQRIEDLQEEYEERQKNANVGKWVVTGLCVVGSIAVIAATGGAATPLVVGAVSATSSAIMAGSNNLANQYVQHGNLFENADKIDWGSFGKDVAIAGVTGFVTGSVGACIGGAVTSGLAKTTIGNTLLHSSSAAVRIGTGAVIGSVSEVTSGAATRAIGTLITTGDVGEALDDASDVKQIVLDATIGGIGGGINEYTSTKQAQKAADDYASTYNEKHNPLNDGEAAGLENLKPTQNNGVDFSDSDYILRTDTGEPIQVKIKSTGDRTKDYKLAEKILKEEYGIDIDFKSMRTGSDKTHVWHHMDDYNVATNETTMQFIDINAHKAIKTHAGSAKQYHIANGQGYGKDSFDVSYGYDPTDEISTIKGGITDAADNVSDTPEFDKKVDTQSTAFDISELYSRFEIIFST